MTGFNGRGSLVHSRVTQRVARAAPVTPLQRSEARGENEDSHTHSRCEVSAYANQVARPPATNAATLPTSSSVAALGPARFVW